MGSAARLRTGAGAHARALVRSPFTVATLLLVPPVGVEVYAQAMASFPALPFVETAPATMGRVSGALFATAFLTGVVGLFQVVSAARVDGRLSLCGYARSELLATRLVAIAGVGAVAATISLGVLWAGVTPEAPAAALGALLVASATYGLLGVLVGTVVTRDLEGSLVLVFLADLDAALSTGLLEVDGTLTALLPLHHAHALFEAAVVDGSLATGHLLPALAYPAVLLVLATAAYARTTGGVGA